METFRMDFAMQRGHEMLLDRETGIVRAELDELELSMLQAAEMPRLLKMDWYDLDGSITFRYLLAGKRMLSHRLQTGPFTMRHYYQLMLAIVEALGDCKHYMLRSEAILLHEHYMYVGEAWSDIGLAYMPVREEPEQSVRERLMALAVRWTIHIEQVDGPGLQRMLRELGTSSADWTGMRELLLELTALAALPDAAGGPLPQQRAAAEPPPYAPSKARTAPVQARVDAPASLPRKQDLSPPAAAPSPPAQQAASWNGSPKPSFSAAATARDHLDLPAPEDLATEQTEERASRRKIIIGAFTVVAAALVWRYGYMDTATTQRAMLCGGLTLLMAGAGYWVYRRSDNAEETELEEESAIQQEIRDYDVEQSAWRWGGWERQQDEAEATPSAVAPAVSVPMSSISNAEAGGIAAGWQVPESPVNPPTVPAPLSGSEETVLLGASSMTAQPNGHGEAYLERLWEGTSERVSLSGGRFVIGRSGENAHYVDDSSGLSRSHLEILKEKSGYAAKDLGSRNGSLLNGESMIPYKLYHIQPGDQLQLAGSHGAVYTFQGN